MSLETKGKTVHLLKASSKPVTLLRKRRKISVMGNPDQYREAMSQPGSQHPSPSKGDMQMEEQKNDKPYPGSFLAPDGEHTV